MRWSLNLAPWMQYQYDCMTSTKLDTDCRLRISKADLGARWRYGQLQASRQRHHLLSKHQWHLYKVYTFQASTWEISKQNQSGLLFFNSASFLPSSFIIHFRSDYFIFDFIKSIYLLASSILHTAYHGYSRYSDRFPINFLAGFCLFLGARHSCGRSHSFMGKSTISTIIACVLRPHEAHLLDVYGSIRLYRYHSDSNRLFPRDSGFRYQDRCTHLFYDDYDFLGYSGMDPISVPQPRCSGLR